MTIDIPPDLEDRVQREAARRGVTAEVLVRSVFDQVLPRWVSALRPNDPRNDLDLLEQWQREDATDDPAELVRRQQEWQELSRVLDRHPEGNG